MSQAADRNVAAVENGTLLALADAGLPVPRPVALDGSGTVLPTPYLVLPLVDGSTDPPALDVALPRMAEFLSRLHDLDATRLALPPDLPRRFDPLPELLEYLPDRFGTLAGVLAHRQPEVPEVVTILHGDFWVGNILWRAEEIVGVIDWEDAALGDPIADVAGARVELVWRYGDPAAERFLNEYERRSEAAISRVRLALWELYVCAAGLAFMGGWGLPEHQVTTMRARSEPFLDRAAGIVLEA